MGSGHAPRAFVSDGTHDYISVHSVRNGEFVFSPWESLGISQACGIEPDVDTGVPVKRHYKLQPFDAFIVIGA